MHANHRNNHRDEHSFYWNLRSFRKSLENETYKSAEGGRRNLIDDDTAVGTGMMDESCSQELRNEKLRTKATEIFGGCQQSHHHHQEQTPQWRRGIVDGKEILFELGQNITSKPSVPRAKRMNFKFVNKNCEGSPLGIRIPLWMMKFSIHVLSFQYFASFLLLNLVFSALFYIDSGRCCDDDTLTLAQVFDFTIQTSTTIGYGGYMPEGYYANFLVVCLSFLAMLLNTLFAGLFFLKFITPVAKVEFSDCIVLCNVNGLPCLQIRVGNADGSANVLTDVAVRLTYSYAITYTTPDGKKVNYGTTDELKLMNNRKHALAEVWTLRHVLDETSPLFGLNLQEYPGSAIYEFRVSLSAVQDLTKTPITAQAGYQVLDVLVGHNFADQIHWNLETLVVTCDYSKMSETVPSPVWYPKACTGTKKQS